MTSIKRSLTINARNASLPDSTASQWIKQSVVVLALVNGAAVGLSLPGRLSYVSEVAREEQFVRACGLYYVAQNAMRI